LLHLGFRKVFVNKAGPLPNVPRGRQCYKPNLPVSTEGFAVLLQDRFGAIIKAATGTKGDVAATRTLSILTPVAAQAKGHPLFVGRQCQNAGSGIVIGPDPLIVPITRLSILALIMDLFVKGLQEALTVFIMAAGEMVQLQVQIGPDLSVSLAVRIVFELSLGKSLVE
jgi:hypothetical protein